MFTIFTLNLSWGQNWGLDRFPSACALPSKPAGGTHRLLGLESMQQEYTRQGLVRLLAVLFPACRMTLQ